MKKKILVADDDFDNRTIIQVVLEAAGYDVLLATNGDEALESACREKPEVLILDMSMPKLNGWEVAKRIRQIPEMAGVVIMAFTAHALVGDELKARAAGCDDYMSKPCLPRDVVLRVASWIEKKSKGMTEERYEQNSHR